MTVIKLSADAKAHLTELISSVQNGHAAQRFWNPNIISCENMLKPEGKKAWARSLREPVLLPFSVGLYYKQDWVPSQYLYQNCFYLLTKGAYTDEQKSLLIQDAHDAERRHFERLKKRFSDIEDSRESRPSIPEKVRIAVWRRDEGKCVRCGSKERLEYDHIIPISKGGSNTARNIELLCEEHNRSKGDKIE